MRRVVVRGILTMNDVKPRILVNDLLLFKPAPIFMFTPYNAGQWLCWEPIGVAEDGNHHRNRKIPVPNDGVNCAVECIKLLLCSGKEISKGDDAALEIF